MSFADKDRLVYDALTNPDAYKAWQQETSRRIDARAAKEPDIWEQFMAMRAADPDYDAKCIAEARAA